MTSFRPLHASTFEGILGIARRLILKPVTLQLESPGIWSIGTPQGRLPDIRVCQSGETFTLEPGNPEEELFEI